MKRIPDFRKFLLISASGLIVLGLVSTAKMSIGFDLANLRSQSTIFTKAYDIIKLQDAWEKIQSFNPPISSVKIGIIDSGVDVQHSEFSGVPVESNIVGMVDFGNTPVSAKKDNALRGHGTQVAGIIGANNLSGLSISLPSDSSQMSGILSGAVPLSKYSLEVSKPISFPLSLFFDTLKDYFTDSRVLNADVINMSIGYVKKSALTSEQQAVIQGQVGPGSFFVVNAIFNLVFSKFSNTSFIVAAGNENVDVSNETPANLGNMSNVITVAATDLDDQRAKFNSFQESNFGNGISISAPGKNVYAPKPGGSYDIPLLNNGVITGGFSGTSASAPMVTGIAGLLKALEPEYQKHITGLLMSPEKIKEVLVKSADPIQTGETNKRLGSGCYNETTTSTGCRLNAHRAVAWLLPPKAVENLTASNITASSITLNWIKPSDFDFQNPDFDSYRVFRSASPNVTINNTLLTAIADPNQISFTDTNLTSNTSFFYKVFVFDKANLSTGSNEISATTSGVSQPSNTWQSVGPMTTERTQHTSTLLNDGRVLITGGLKGSGQTSTFLNSAEVFDPLTNTFSSVGNLNISRAFHAATLLNDGRVLITGGSSDGNNFLNTAEIFNPSTNTFTLISNMNEARFFHTANLLDSGKVLIAGGVNGQPVKSTEIFDPSTNTFSPGSDMIEKRSHHASVKLNDGRVLLVNGLQADSLTPVEIYDPAANSFTSATSSVEQLGLSVNTLPNGKVLIEGSKLFNQPQGLAAEIFDPVNNAFVEIGPMLILGTARDSSVLLNSGEVLFVGENIKAQLFNLQTNTFKLTGDLNIPSSLQHQLTLLQDGRALLTGVQLLGSVITSDAEVFKP